MSERPIRSSLYALEPLVRKLPEVEVPKRHISFNEKLLWSGLALVIFLVMGQIPLYGIVKERLVNVFGGLQFVLASRTGTLMQLGISPIVTAGIIMQLLVGANIVDLDLSHRRDKALFTGVQKILAIVVGTFQASAFVLSGAFGTLGALGTGMICFLILQLVIGVLAVLYLDELVSKYGFGSGIGLFIAGGVSMTVFWQALGFNPFTWTPTGAIPKFIALGDFWGRPSMMGLIATIIIFFIVIYAESMRVEIPLAYSRFGGMRGRYPIKFIYASVIPVILSMVLFTNVRILAMVTGWSPLGTFDGGTPTGGLYYYLSSPRGIHGVNGVAADPIRAVVYIGILMGACMAFAWLWVQMTNMGPGDVAQQLKRSGMSIPGFRRDTRIMENMLGRYITPVTLLGGATVGALAAGANFLGALSSGTGILLTVSIIYRLYQEISRERVAEMFPAARRFLAE